MSPALLLLAFGCSPPPPPVDTPAPAPAPRGWTLEGLADDSHLPLPELPGGHALLGTACFEANQRLTTLDPRHPGEGPPCGVEQWTDGTYTLRLLWTGDVGLVERDGAAHAAVTRWHAVDTLLAECTGPLLNLPPAGDPGGTRGTDGERWLLSFSGANRCGLEGTLVLWMRADRADPAQVRVAGQPWRSGGSALAEARLSPERRSQAPAAR